MGARTLGVDEKPFVCARVSVAAAHHAEFQRLCGPSSALPHHSDPFRHVFRSAIRRKDSFGVFWWSGGSFLLLAGPSLSHSLRARLVNRAAGMFRAVLVSHEHGQGATARRRLSRRRDSPVFPKEILAFAAAGRD